MTDALAMASGPPHIPAKVASCVRELRARLKVAEVAILDCLDLVDEAIQGGYYYAYGYREPGPWFEDVLGIRYDSLSRRLRLLDGLRALPAAEVPAAREAIAEMGASRARHFAAVLLDERTREHWRDCLPAEGQSVESYAEWVGDRLDRPRKEAHPPGDMFLRALLTRIPQDAREEVEEVFRLGRRLAETQNNVAVFLAMTKEVLQEWRHR